MFELLSKSMTPFCVWRYDTDVSEAYCDAHQGKQKDNQGH